MGQVRLSLEQKARQLQGKDLFLSVSGIVFLSKNVGRGWVSVGVHGEGGRAVPLQLGAAQTHELRLRPAAQKTCEQSHGAQR